MAKLLDDSAISSGVPSPVTVSLSLATLTSRDRKASDDPNCVAAAALTTPRWERQEGVALVPEGQQAGLSHPVSHA